MSSGVAALPALLPPLLTGTPPSLPPPPPLACLPQIKREIKILQNLYGGPNVIKLLDVVRDPQVRAALRSFELPCPCAPMRAVLAAACGALLHQGACRGGCRGGGGALLCGGGGAWLAIVPRRPRPHPLPPPATLPSAAVQDALAHLRVRQQHRLQGRRAERAAELVNAVANE